MLFVNVYSVYNVYCQAYNYSPIVLAARVINSTQQAT